MPDGITLKEIGITIAGLPVGSILDFHRGLISIPGYGNLSRGQDGRWYETDLTPSAASPSSYAH